MSVPETWEERRADEEAAARILVEGFTELGMTRIATQESVNKLSRAKMGAGRGRKLSPETRAKIAARKRGVRRKPYSAEHRRKISEAAKRRWGDPEFRPKYVESARGPRPRRYTPELAAEVYERYEEGTNTVDLAAQYGVSQSTITNWIARCRNSRLPAAA